MLNVHARRQHTADLGHSEFVVILNALSQYIRFRKSALKRIRKPKLRVKETAHLGVVTLIKRMFGRQVLIHQIPEARSGKRTVDLVDVKARCVVKRCGGTPHALSHGTVFLCVIPNGPAMRAHVIS